MPSRPIISSMFYLPLSTISKKDVMRLMDELTVVDITPSPTFGEPPTRTEVCCFDLSKAGYIGLPRHYGMKKYAHLSALNCTIKGKYDDANMRNACNVVPRDSRQKDFMTDIANVCKSNKIVDYVANARTGSGKTVADLIVSSELGVPTLIIVPTNKLKFQWLGNIAEKNGIKYFFGEEWFNKYVGTVQQGVCDYKGKLLVVGLAPSLAKRDYGEEFYNYFGKVTIDEVHTMSAPMTSEIFKKFPAAIRGGYTATNKEGALRKICEFHLGKPSVTSEQEVLKPIVYIVDYLHTQRMTAHNEYQYISGLASDLKRNKLLANIIKSKGFDRDRQIVCLSDRVYQLQHIEHILIHEHGIPKESIGIHAGALNIVHPDVANKNVPVWDLPPSFLKKVKVKDSELTRIANECPIILASYGTFALGIDVKRLDMGVELTPRGNVTQALGRIVRENPGKHKEVPEWWSINDASLDNPLYQSFSLSHNKQQFDYFMSRFKARNSCFERQKATIIRIRSK